MFYSFKQEKQYVNPTAEIELKSIKSVKTDDSKGENAFVCYKNNFYRKFKWLKRISSSEQTASPTKKAGLGPLAKLW